MHPVLNRKRNMLLVSAIVFILSALLSWAFPAHAGDVYTQGVDITKTVSCTNATTRTDGSALPENEIKKVEVYFTPNADLSWDSTMPVISLSGGCANPGSLDLQYLDPLLTDGGTTTFYEYGMTVACDADCSLADHGQERYSGKSKPYVFTYKVPVAAKATPDVPVMTK